MDTINDISGLSLGLFRDEIDRIKNLYLTGDEPLEPLSISMPVDNISVILGASPYIALRSGGTSITLSHIQNIKRSVKHGRKSYRIICGNYTASNEPSFVEYRIFYDE